MRTGLRKQLARCAWVTLAGGLACGLATAPLAAASPNLVANGSFEQPSLAGTGTNVEFYGPGLIPYGVGTSWPIPNQSLSGWTFASGSVDVNTSAVWQAADGTQSVDLSGVGPGAIYQDLATAPGDSYNVAFAMSGNPFCGAGVKQVEVDWGGAPIAAPTFNTAVITSAQNMQYADHSYTVQAASATTRLELASLTNNSCGPVIDAVSVTNAYNDLCLLVQQDAAKAGIAQSLCAKLSAAEADALRGDAGAKAGVLGAFANELAAQTGKAFTTAQAGQIGALAAQL